MLARECPPPSGLLVDAADLVGVGEIAVRAGVTGSAVTAWSYLDDFPEPVRVLLCGSVWSWTQVAQWLTDADLPPRGSGALRRLSDADAVELAALAEELPREKWRMLARERGIGVDLLRNVVKAARLGEAFGWFTQARRQREVSCRA